MYNSSFWGSRRIVMVRIGAYVYREQVYSTAVRIVVKTNVARDFFRADATSSQHITSLQPNLLWTYCL